MPITKQISPYELLYRFNPDGTIHGGHFQQISRVIDEDGVTPLSEVPMTVQPILLGVSKAGIDPKLVGAAFDASLHATIDAHEATIEQLRADAEQKEKDSEEALNQLRSTHYNELLAKDANVQELMGKIERLQVVVDTFREETTTEEPATTVEVEQPTDAKPAE